MNRANYSMPQRDPQCVPTVDELAGIAPDWRDSDSCPACDRVHRMLVRLGEETVVHDGHARRLRAAGDRRRVRDAERHEAMARVLREVREQLARALCGGGS